MPKKHRYNPLEIRVQAVSLPKGTKPEAYLRRLIRAVDNEEPLPRGWDVRLHWRNRETRSGRTRRWQEDDFLNAVQDSRSGFNDILRGLLVSRLYRARSK